eukprot:scaffold59971_cov34-Phaeocystis_antarctica.AAC.1
MTRTPSASASLRMRREWRRGCGSRRRARARHWARRGPPRPRSPSCCPRLPQLKRRARRHVPCCSRSRVRPSARSGR